MKPPKWINTALRNELELIRVDNQDSQVKLLEVVVHSPNCKRVWKKSEALTTNDSNGQVWLARTILKALAAIDEDMTDAEKWRESIIEAANKVSNKLRDRPKEKYVTECENMAAKLDEFIEEFRVNFKTTKFAARPSKGDYADREHFTKKLIIEYSKRCIDNDAHEADVRRITNALHIDNGGIFKRKISESSISGMTVKVRADYSELTAGPAITPSITPK